MEQRTLFDAPPPPAAAPPAEVPPRDPNVTPEEAPRLSRQCREILERLRRGDASNKELAGLALKYTSRLSDLRAAGFRVRVISRDYETGEVWYRLDAEGV